MKVDRRKFIAAGSAALSGAALAQAARAAPAPRRLRDQRRIATEEAFTTPEQAAALIALAGSNWRSLDLGLWADRTVEGAVGGHLALEGERVRIMDENGVAMQVLSLTSPGVQMFNADLGTEIAINANDRLFETIQRYPGRFAGLAAFAPQDPARATKEMERAISKLGLNGFISNSHTNGEYMDDPKYWPILEAAEALDRPIYIHPRSPSDAMIDAYGHYGMELAVWGYQAEVGLHAMRLILGGIFDRFPNLKIVIGHMGKNIPFHLWRTDNKHRSERSPLKRKPSEYFVDNFVITTSGVRDHMPLDYSVKKLGADNVLWAVDFPYEDTRLAVEAMDSAPFSQEVINKIYYENAERIFKIKNL